jgi:hypothetical protein
MDMEEIEKKNIKNTETRKNSLKEINEYIKKNEKWRFINIITLGLFLFFKLQLIKRCHSCLSNFLFMREGIKFFY